MPGFRSAEDTRPIVAASGMSLSSQGETIPGISYASSSGWPPPGFTTGDQAVSSSSSSTGLVSGLPSFELDLQWLQGDTFRVPILFTDVRWTPTDPEEDAPVEHDVTNRLIDTNEATLTIPGHPFIAGSSVTVSGVGTAYNGTVLVTAATSSTITYTVDADDESVVATDGTAILANKPAWVETLWGAQVRNPYVFSTYTSDYWVPAHGNQYRWWQAHSVVASFRCDPEILYGYVLDQAEDQYDADGNALDTYNNWVDYDIDVAVPAGHTLRWATQVTCTMVSTDSVNILPGSWYRWDLQSRNREAVTTYDPTPDEPLVTDDVTTHVRGRVQVLQEWTRA